MSRLRETLTSLSGIDSRLEAYNRAGECACGVSGAQFARAVSRFRKRLRDRDPARSALNGRPAIALLFRPEETVEFLVSALAAMAERICVVPLFPSWGDASQREYLEAYGLRSVLVGSASAAKVRRWLGSVLDDVVEVRIDDELVGEDGEDPSAEDLFPSDIAMSDPLAYIFTSGTSGKLAKLTEITHENLDAAIENIVALDFLHAGMVLHSPLSTSHIFAFVVVLGFLALKPRRLIFSDIQYLARLPQERTGKIDGLILVPIVLNRIRAGLYEKLMAEPRGFGREDRDPLARIPLGVRRQLKRILQRAENAVLDLEMTRRVRPRDWCALQIARRLLGRKIRRRLGSPTFVVVGGAKPNLQAMSFLEVMGIRCLQGWGMTETTGPLAVRRLSDRFRGGFDTCGDLFPRTTAEIDGGELIVTGPQIATGYLEPSGRFIPFDGKKRTGDYAQFDPGGRLKILGKASDRITTENGLNYNPIPLEEGLIALDLDRRHMLEEAVVIGDGQPRLGVALFLRGEESGPGAEDYLRQLLRDFNERLAVDERLEVWTISPEPFKESGLLGPSGKLVRRLAEERFATMFPQPAKMGS